MPDPKVQARVFPARGRIERLRYTLRPIPGQAVTFVEHAGAETRIIGAARGTHGEFGFRPADIRVRRRTIIAWITQDGHPRANLTIASYIVPAPRRLPPPRGLRVTRRDATVIVSWRPEAGAVGYALSARLGDGRRVFVVVRAASHQQTIASVPATVGGRLRLTAITDKKLRRLGRSALVTLRPGRPQPRIVIKAAPF